MAVGSRSKSPARLRGLRDALKNRSRLLIAMSASLKPSNSLTICCTICRNRLTGSRKEAMLSKLRTARERSRIVSDSRNSGGRRCLESSAMASPREEFNRLDHNSLPCRFFEAPPANGDEGRISVVHGVYRRMILHSLWGDGNAGLRRGNVLLRLLTMGTIRKLTEDHLVQSSTSAVLSERFI